MTQYEFSRTLLREYDLRGIVGKTLTLRDAELLGRAFGTLIARRNGNRVVIGYDGRLTSPSLTSACVEGLRSAGMDIVDIGLGPTPMLYFAERLLQTDAGVMVTGSHNPAEYNGFKLTLGGASIHGAQIQELAAIAQRGDFAKGSGRASAEVVFEAYVARLLQDVDLPLAPVVSWDPGNGAAGPVVESLMRALPGRHIGINLEVDGRFPAHHPDPTLPETLRQLRQSVKRGGCDVGFAFDGDGDRIGVIDDRGRVLWGDQLMILWAAEILRDSPGAKIIADVKASQTLFDAITSMGGQPIMGRTGHSLIKAKMRETGAVLAGEMSGHIFFADRYFGFDDALYAALRLLNVVSQSGESLSQLHDKLPKARSTPEIRIDCAEDEKFDIVDQVRTRLEREGADVNAIDGVRVRTDEGWWLLRASNTQNVLVVRCEAEDSAGLERLKDVVARQLTACGLGVAAIERGLH